MFRRAVVVPIAAIACVALPVQIASGAAVSHDQVTVSDAEPGGDGDGFIEPTESFSIKERVHNDSGAPLNLVSASLSSLTPFLTITQPTSAYPDLGTGATGENATAFTASTTSAVACGTNLQMRLDVSTAQGPASTTFAVPVQGKRFAADNRTAVAIPDNNPAGITSTVELPAGIGALSDLNVSLAITHTFNADLDVSLTHGATTLFLFTDVNGGGDGMSVTLDDEATTAIEAAGVAPAGTPLTGTFRPETPASLDAAFGGVEAGGTWTLKIVDDSAGDIGTLDSWEVDPAGPCNRAPLASFVIAPSSLAPGQTATLVSTSQDFDGSIGAYAWDLDGDGAYDDATGIQATRTFPSAGTFPIGLKVTDNKGEIDTVTRNVTVAASQSAPTGRLVASFRRLPKQSLGTALKHGLRVPVRLSAAATVRATASVTSAVAKRFGLAATRSVAVARGSKRARAGAGTVVVKFTTKAKRRLRHARSVKLRIALTATATGRASKKLSRTVTLKR
jgi:subtilisin-like proprotein convertase family protein